MDRAGRLTFSFVGLPALVAALALSGCDSPKADSSTTKAAVAAATKGDGGPGDDTEVTPADLADEKDAETAEKKPDPRLHGTYQAVLDESAISLANRRRPDYAEIAEKARENAPTITFYANGSIHARLTNGKSTGFLSMIKGRVTLVLKNPDKTSKIKFLTLPIRIYDNGADFTLNLAGPTKPLYKKVTVVGAATPAAPAPDASAAPAK